MANYPEDLAVWDRLPGPPPTESLDAFVDNLAANGIDRGVFTGREVRDEEGDLVRGVPNEYVAECVDEYPDRLTGFAGVHHAGDIVDAVDRIEHAVTNLGLSGVSIDPGYDLSIPIDDRRLYPLYYKAVDLDVPVVLTVGPNHGTIPGDNHDPGPIEKVAVDFRDLTMVLSHGVWPKVDEFVALAYRRPNVYLEASIYEFFPGADAFIEAAEDLITDSVVYASAFPFNPLDTVDRFRDLPLSDESLEQILWENPAKILDLK